MRPPASDAPHWVPFRVLPEGFCARGRKIFIFSGSFEFYNVFVSNYTNNIKYCQSKYGHISQICFFIFDRLCIFFYILFVLYRSLPVFYA